MSPEHGEEMAGSRAILRINYVFDGQGWGQSHGRNANSRIKMENKKLKLSPQKGHSQVSFR